MTFRNPGRTIAAAAVLIAQMLMMTACSSTTIDFLYVATNKQSPGQINVYTVDHVSGALHQLNTSPFPAGRNPVAMVTSPDGKNLYVVNEDDSTVEQFAIGTDGKLYPNSTFQSQGGSALPVAVAYDAAAKYLYIAYTYQPQYSALNPGAGDLVIVSLNADGTFGSQILNTTLGTDYWPVGFTPSAVAAQVDAAGTATNVYVASLGATSNSTGLLYSFQVASAVVSARGSIAAGTQPSGVAAEPSGKYVYVTDEAQARILAYQASTTNVLQAITTGGPYVTGNMPSAITVLPEASLNGYYLLVSNYSDGRVSSYLVPSSTGIPPATATGSGVTATGPIALAVDPEQGRFVYTANFSDNSVSGLLFDSSNGSLISTQNTPYRSNAQPTAIAIIPHGSKPVL